MKNKKKKIKENIKKEEKNTLLIYFPRSFLISILKNISLKLLK